MKRNNFKKRIKSLMYVFIILFISLVGLKNTSAEEATLWSYNFSGFYAYTVLDGNPRLFYLKSYRIDNRLAFCIELGKGIPDNVYSYSTDYESLGYTKEQIEYISLIAYYGYGYPGRMENYAYLMATQELIWEYLSGVDVGWTNDFSLDNPKLMDNTKVKQIILDSISKHYIKPSFIDNDYYYNLGEDININDDNNILSEYELTSDDGLDISINNNSLVINNASIGDYEIKLKRKGYKEGLSSLIYYNESSQKLFSVGEINLDEYSFNIHISGATLNVYKYDSHTMSSEVFTKGVLSGAKYGLYDSNNNLIDEFITDENGMFSVSDLSFGEYYLKEIAPSLGYKLDTNVYKININKIDNELIVYEDVEDDANIKVYKYDSYTMSSNPLENCLLSGAKYGLYDKNNNKVDEFVTDENGSFIINNLFYDKYYIKELEASYGYELDDTLYEIDISEKDNELIVFENPIFKRLEICKTYGDNHMFESGITFNVINNNGDIYGSIITDLNGYGYIDLPVGSYVIKQVNTNDGYLLSNDIIIDITNDSDNVITYNLQDDKISENPHTYDNIVKNFVCLILSLFTILSLIIFYFKVRKNN